jgi:ribosome-associated protein
MTHGEAGESDAPVEAMPVSVTTPITLGQFLKAAGLVSTGGEAKYLIVSGLVQVNDEVDIRRGRKLYAGDVVSTETGTARVAAADPQAATSQPGPGSAQQGR